MDILIERLAHAMDLPLPVYATPGAAGADLHAAVSSTQTIDAGQFAMVPTGLILQIPHGFEVQIRPRSGLAAKHGVTVLNAPGTIDSDYRGEVQVLLVNLGRAPFDVTRGMRIAQMVVAPVVQAQLAEAAVERETARGSGGFGSTGT